MPKKEDNNSPETIPASGENITKEAKVGEDFIGQVGQSGTVNPSGTVESTRTKVCYECGLTKPVVDFRRDSYFKDGVYYKCRVCQDAATVALRREKRARAQRKTERQLRNNRIAKLFAFWMSIPATVKDAGYFQKVKNVEVTEEMETLMPDILKAKTLTEVAKVLGVSAGTLSKWSKQKNFQKLVERFDTHNNLMRFKRDIDYNFTQATIKYSDAPRVKLWYQIHMGWVEKTANTLEVPTETTEDIQKTLRQLAEKKQDQVKGFSAERLKAAIVEAKAREET